METSQVGCCIEQTINELNLHVTEAELFRHIYAHRGRACSKEDLEKILLNNGVAPTSMVVYMHRIRTKLSLHKRYKEFQLATVRGIGYRLTLPPNKCPC